MTAKKRGAERPTELKVGGREAILMTALRLFAEHGVDGVSMRTVAQTADVSLGLIWKYFGPKEALRAAIDEYVIGVLDRENEHLLELQRQSGMQTLTVEGDRPISQYAWELRYLRRALLDRNEASMTMFRRYFDVGEKYFARLIDVGEVRSDVDKTMLTMFSIFIALGPLFLEPYCKAVFGLEIFDPAFTDKTSKFYQALLLKGVSNNG